MPKPNTASSAPPFEVEAALKRLGANLRTARLARNLSIEAAAAKIGVGYRAVATAEAGKPGTAIGGLCRIDVGLRLAASTQRTR